MTEPGPRAAAALCLGPSGLPGASRPLELSAARRAATARAGAGARAGAAEGRRPPRSDRRGLAAAPFLTGHLVYVSVK